MPIYTWTSQEGTFSEDQKKALAKIVTETHCEATGAPRDFVRVLFRTYPAGSCFLAEAESSTGFPSVPHSGRENPGNEAVEHASAP